MAEQTGEKRAYCPKCGLELEEDAEWCPEDGARLYTYTVSDDSDDLVGATLDERFRVDRLLGEGGMGKVYAGCQLSIDREVAIKVLQPDLVGDEQAIKRFFREARVVSGLNHPNIVQLYDFGQEETTGLVYYVMEMVAGRELEQVLQTAGGSRLAAPLALEVARQACRGLAEPHAEGIVHRDLKPENLMLVPMADGHLQVKVLDFGLARTLQTDSSLTSTGLVCGTAHYMSPEQAQGADVGPMTDIYALGCVLFEMLTGAPMFQGDSATQLMLKHVNSPPPDLGQLAIADEIPEGTADLVRTMVHKEPAGRPDAIRDVQERIDAIRESSGLERIAIETEEPLVDSLDDWMRDSAEVEPVAVDSGATVEREGGDVDPVAPTAAATTPSSGEPAVVAESGSDADEEPEADSTARAEGNQTARVGARQGPSTRYLAGAAVALGLVAVVGFLVLQRLAGPEADSEAASPPTGAGTARGTDAGAARARRGSGDDESAGRGGPERGSSEVASGSPDAGGSSVESVSAGAQAEPPERSGAGGERTGSGEAASPGRAPESSSEPAETASGAGEETERGDEGESGTRPEEREASDETTAPGSDPPDDDSTRSDSRATRREETRDDEGGGDDGLNVFPVD